MKIAQENFDQAIVVRLEGRLDAAAVRDERDTLVEAADQAKKWLIINMDKVDFIDSSGLGLIVSLVRRTREHGSDLAMCNLTPQAQSLFELTRMTKIFAVHASEEAALEAAGL